MVNKEGIKRAEDGKDRWNDWAAEELKKPLDQRAKIDFSDISIPADIDFSGFVFPVYANFRGAAFSFEVNFNGATFKGGAFFEGAIFESGAGFNDATFKSGTYFKDATFENGADFNDATFKGKADFEGATFKSRAFFQGATFEKWAYFKGATFKDWAGFTGATFENRADFEGATFEGLVNFNNAKFKSTTVLTGATFKIAPSFHNADIYQDTAFSSGKKFFNQFPDIKSYDAKNDCDEIDAAERAYRTLKLAMSKYQSHTEEAGFFKLELKARAKKEPWYRKWMYGAYDLFSDYGQSVSWPLFWWLYLALIAFAFHSGIAIALHGVMAAGGSNAPFTVTMAQAIPLIGVEKKAYYDALKALFPCGTPILFYVSRALHMVASSALIFLMLLALRNRFKIK